jgi:hypothetical protein
MGATGSRGGNVGNRGRRGARHGDGATLGTCVRCGRDFELVAMVQWREGAHCLRDALAVLETEQHETELELRRELRAINADRAAATREEDRERRGENMVRGW